MISVFEELADIDPEDEDIELSEEAEILKELIGDQIGKYKSLLHFLEDLGDHEFENWSYSNNFRITKDMQGKIIEVEFNIFLIFFIVKDND